MRTFEERKAFRDALRKHRKTLGYTQQVYTAAVNGWLELSPISTRITQGQLSQYEKGPTMPRAALAAEMHRFFDGFNG